MSEFRYRLIDTAGGEIGIFTFDRPSIAYGESVMLPDESVARVVDV